MITPVALSNIGYKYYIFLSITCACIPISVYFLYPETRGQSLEELETLFRNDLSIWQVVKLSKQRAFGGNTVEDLVGKRVRPKAEQIEQIEFA